MQTATRLIGPPVHSQDLFSEEYLQLFLWDDLDASWYYLLLFYRNAKPLHILSQTLQIFMLKMRRFFTSFRILDYAEFRRQTISFLVILFGSRLTKQLHKNLSDLQILCITRLNTSKALAGVHEVIVTNQVKWKERLVNGAAFTGSCSTQLRIHRLCLGASFISDHWVFRTSCFTLLPQNTRQTLLMLNLYGASCRVKGDDVPQVSLPALRQSPSSPKHQKLVPCDVSCCCDSRWRASC